ncbi:MAG: glycosyltransferase family 87 protein [Caldilineaceae bacterium]
MSAIKKSRPQANGLHVPAIWGEIVGYGFIAVTAVLAPLWLIHLNVPFIRLMDEVYHPIVLLQLFTFTATVALTITLAAKLWQLRDEGFQAAVPFVLGVLVIFHFLALMRQHAARSWDYICYERAAQAIVAGANPYGDCYIYFPTPAQMLATLYHVGAWVSSMADPTGMAAESSARWDLVFYLYESTQLILVAVAFALCYRLARVSGLQRLYAAGLVTALFLLNNPLLSTLKHNQVNLWVLNLMLLAILGVARYPLLSGLCVALGGHIKLYPLALLLPWMLKRQWRALFSAGIGLIGIFFLQTNGGRSLTLWQQFLDFADSFPRGTFFRDNSLHSFVYNTLGHLKWLLGEGSFPVNELYVSRFVLLGMGLLGMVYLVRFFNGNKRHRDHSPLPEHVGQRRERCILPPG